MSTRANVIIQESYSCDGKIKTDKMYFYRHSDGYPEGVMPTLNVFMKWLKNGDLRSNPQQCAGWLIMLGAIEYSTIPRYNVTEEKGFMDWVYKNADLDSIETPEDWKVGAYEPTTCIHGDIEYLYVIDLTKKELKCYDSWTPKGEGKHEVELKTQTA